MKAHSLDYLSVAVMILAVAALFLTAPADGSFGWSDSPRHALNGVFVRDLIAAAPFQNPTQFAYDYYAKYPALTILFYPPLFYAISAPFYAVFGFTHPVALAVVALHYAIFALGLYRLSRFWFSPPLALCATLIVAIAPAVAVWGRQVMLEIPALCFLVWSAVFFMRYRAESKSTDLWLCAIFALATIYTKLSFAFILPVYALTLLLDNGKSAARDKRNYIVAAAIILGLAPLILITAKFGQANMQSVSGIGDAEAGRWTLSGLTWYLRAIPEQLGWGATIYSLLGIGSLALRGDRSPLPKTDLRFLLIWFAGGYLFFSMIDLKEARHSLPILVPLVLAATAGIRTLFEQRMAVPAAAAIALITIGQTFIATPVHAVRGYADAAAFIAREAPKDSVVLFSGVRDGAFVFNMRTHSDRRDLSTIRADKLLLKVAVRRSLGVEEKQLDTEDIRNKIDDLGCNYVVMQPGFWTDLPVMRRFEEALMGPQFKRITRIPIAANYPGQETELIIYRNDGAKSGNRQIDIDLPIIGRSIRGGTD